MSSALLGIDLGTSSVKVVLIDIDGAVLAQAGADYPVDRAHPGWAETDPERWWSAIRDATRQVRSSVPMPPVAIGLSGQMHGVVICDRHGRPTRPALLWSDSRAEAELDTYRKLPAADRARLGNPLSPGMAGPMLGWLAAHEPGHYRAARWALQPKDWVRSRLTGRFRAEPSDASATLLYDLTTQNWDPVVAAALHLDPVQLAPIVAGAGEYAGDLLPDIATELDLPAGIPVAAGAADTAAGALGSGLREPGSLQLTIGTGAQLITPITAPNLDTLLAAGDPVTHTYRAASAAGWYAMGAVLNGGLTLDWVRKTLGASWTELYRTAEQAVPAPDGPLFIPHLNGERTPHMDTSLRASWVGLTARHDRDDLLHAALEGVAFAITDARDALAAAHPTGRDLRLAGGGSVAPGWRQMLADITQLDVYALDVTHASARGAALTGALAAGLLDESTVTTTGQPPTALVAVPRPDRAAYYAARRLIARDAFQALRGQAFHAETGQ